MGHASYHKQDEVASSLWCEMKIIRAKNLEFLSFGSIFVRLYLKADKGEKIRLNSRAIELYSNDLSWDECFSLQCRSSEGKALEELRRQKVVGELRWRSSSHLFNKVVGSKLLGKVEIAWRDVIEADGMKMERWFPVIAADGKLPMGDKPPAIQLDLRVSNTKKDGGKMECRRKLPPKNWEGCACVHDPCTASDYEIFALAALDL